MIRVQMPQGAPVPTPMLSPAPLRQKVWHAPLAHPVRYGRNRAQEVATLGAGLEAVLARAGRADTPKLLERTITSLSQAAESGAPQDIAISTRHLARFLDCQN